jgi:hypothetical protein
VAPAAASPHLGAYEDFILCSKSLGPTTTRMSPSDLWAIAKKLKKEPEEFLHLSSSTRKGTAADLFWTSGGVLLLQDFFSDEDQKKFCSSRVEEQKKKKKKKEKMSFVFRGSRGDLESGLQNFMTARRNVVRSFVLSFSCCSVLYQAFLLSLSLVLVEESPMLLLKPELCLCLCLCLCISLLLSSQVFYQNLSIRAIDSKCWRWSTIFSLRFSCGLFQRNCEEILNLLQSFSRALKKKLPVQEGASFSGKEVTCTLNLVFSSVPAALLFFLQEFVFWACKGYLSIISGFLIMHTSLQWENRKIDMPFAHKERRNSSYVGLPHSLQCMCDWLTDSILTKVKFPCLRSGFSDRDSMAPVELWMQIQWHF